MSSRKEKKERKKKKLALIVISCLVFGVGYYILNEVSTWFEVPLGITFYIILGCSLMAISGIYIVYTIKKLYFTKRRKRTNHIFLDDNSKNPKS